MKIIQLDVERELKFDHKAIWLLEERMGCGISKVLQSAGDPALHLLANLIWCGLQHNSKTTFDQAKMYLYSTLDSRDFADIYGDVFTVFLDDLKQFRILPDDKKKAELQIQTEV